MKLRRQFVLVALAFVLLLAGTVFHTQVLGSGRKVFDTDDYAEGKEKEEGTLPEGWIEIGDHAYLNPSPESRPRSMSPKKTKKQKDRHSTGRKMAPPQHLCRSVLRGLSTLVVPSFRIAG